MSIIVRIGLAGAGLLTMAHLLRDEKGFLPVTAKWLFRFIGGLCLLIIAIAVCIFCYLAGSLLLQFLGWY